MNNQLSYYISIEPEFFQELEGESGVKITGKLAIFVRTVEIVRLPATKVLIDCLRTNTSWRLLRGWEYPSRIPFVEMNADHSFFSSARSWARSWAARSYSRFSAADNISFSNASINSGTLRPSQSGCSARTTLLASAHGTRCCPAGRMCFIFPVCSVRNIIFPRCSTARNSMSENSSCNSAVRFCSCQLSGIPVVCEEKFPGQNHKSDPDAFSVIFLI